jgi:hypothetical protein
MPCAHRLLRLGSLEGISPVLIGAESLKGLIIAPLIRSAAARVVLVRSGITVFPEEHQNSGSLFTCN